MASTCKWSFKTNVDNNELKCPRHQELYKNSKFIGWLHPKTIKGSHLESHNSTTILWKCNIFTKQSHFSPITSEQPIELLLAKTEVWKRKKERWFMGACRTGWSPANIQARHPSTIQSGKYALLGYPPHAVPSSLTPALPGPPTGPRRWLRVWSGQAFHTRPTAHIRRPMSTPLCPHSGHRRPLHHPAVCESPDQAL